MTANWEEMVPEKYLHWEIGDVLTSILFAYAQHGQCGNLAQAKSLKCCV